MYAPHASLAPLRPAALARVDVDRADDLGVGPLIPAVSAIGAIAALCVAVALLRVYPLPMWPAAGLVLGRGRPLAGGAHRAPGPAATLSSPAWFGVATGLTGLAALVPLAGAWLGVRPLTLSTVVTVASVAAGAAYLAALTVMIPAVGLAARLRSLADGAVVCLFLLFCAWSLVVRHTQLDPVLLGVITFHCWVLATAMLAGTGTGAGEGRRGATFCAAGVWLTTMALSALTFALARGLSTGWLVFTGVVLVAAPVLVWRGAVALTARPAARLVTIPRPLATAAAGAVAMFATLHQLLEGERIDWGAFAIGGAAVLGVGVRHLVWGAPAEATAPEPAAETLQAAPVAAAALGSRPAPYPAASLPAGFAPVVVHVDAPAGLATGHQLAVAIAGLSAEPHCAGALIAVGVDDLEDAVGAREAELLAAVDRRLRAVGEPAAVLARVSPSRFALLTRDGEVRAYGLATRLLAALREPVQVAGRGVNLSVSVGLTRLAGAPGPQEVLRRADLALVRAQQLGTGVVEWYDPQVEEAIQRHDTIERELPGALRRGELDLIYQPIMDLVHDRPMAVEALLRWRHPRLGTLYPADVIPAAAETGVLGEVSHWVLRQAAAQLCSWRDAGRDLSMSINISPRQLDPAELTSELRRVLGAHQLPADRLVFEVAESAIEDGGRLAEDLGALRSVGVRTAIDEFGAGPESLSHLRQMPIDMVKIGKSFFDAAHAVPLADVIVGVGRRLGVDVVAQCLEAPAHLDVVRTAGCRIGQGRLFAPPQPAEHTEAYLAGFPTRT